MAAFWQRLKLESLARFHSLLQEGAVLVQSKPFYFLKTRSNELIENLQSWVEIKYKDRSIKIANESKERIARNELARFAHPLVRFGVFLSALFVFIAILQFTSPPKLIKTMLIGKRFAYVNDVDICFGNGCLNNVNKVHKVSLPFFNIQDFKDYQDFDLYYRFDLKKIKSLNENSLDTFFAPIVWGDAEVFRSGVKVASGPKFWPVIPVLSVNDEIVIHVFKPSGAKFGLRGTFPPLICKRDLARDLEKEVYGEPFQIRYSFVAQLAGLSLLLVMFLTFPFRPELFSFLVLFGIETLRAEFWYIRDQGDSIVSSVIDSVLYNALLFFGSVAILFFISTFFRRPVQSVIELIEQHIGKIIFIIVAGYFLMTAIFSEISTENALFVTLWSVSLVLSFVLVKDTLVFLFVHKARARFLLGIAALAGVAYWAIVNIRDHFVLTNAITTEYTNHLHFFFFMSIVLGIEIGRTEVKIKEAFSLLPREVVRLIHEKNEEWREGFVVLVDVVGWSEKLNLLGEDSTPEYMKRVNEYLLSFFDEPGTSVVSGTGDGFYLTLEGPATEERFYALIEACERLATFRPTFQSIGVELEEVMAEKIVVRSAVGYGKYYVGFVQSKYLKKEFLAGFIATHLARVIGNDKDPLGPKILSGSQLDQYRNGREELIERKKTENIPYWKSA